MRVPTEDAAAPVACCDFLGLGERCEADVGFVELTHDDCRRVLGIRVFKCVYRHNIVTCYPIFILFIFYFCLLRLELEILHIAAYLIEFLESLEGNDLILLDLFTEEHRYKHLRMAQEHDFLLGIAIVQGSTTNKLIGKVYFECVRKLLNTLLAD